MILMKKVQVKEINNYVYTLITDDNKTYDINIEFYDTSVDIGDYIFIDDKVLEETNLYAYGPIKENNDPEDLIKIVKDDKEIYLQRYYG